MLKKQLIKEIKKQDETIRKFQENHRAKCKEIKLLKDDNKDLAEAHKELYEKEKEYREIFQRQVKIIKRLSEALELTYKEVV